MSLATQTLKARLRICVQGIRHARTHYVCKYQSCIVFYVGLVVHAPVDVRVVVAHGIMMVWSATAEVLHTYSIYFTVHSDRSVLALSAYVDAPLGLL